MISHKHKLIYIHIQRTGGTAIERLFVKQDQWYIKSEHKHLLASQAKKVYKDYWNDYFKFSVIRDPWARTTSWMKFAHYLHLGKTDQGKINFDNWVKKHTVQDTNVIIENDFRFSDLNELYNKEKHKDRQVYLNILDEELDYICNFDTLKKDITHILKVNNLNSNLGNYFKKPNISYENYFTEETKQQVNDLYENDIKFFNFKFGDGKLLTRY